MVVKVHMYLFLVFAYMFALGKLRIFALSYIFIILHELAHITIAKLLHVDVQEVELLPVGINAKYKNSISPIKELFISLAGPCTSFLFYIFLDNKILKEINLFIVLTNLIPLKPYDGGRILTSFFTIIIGECKAKKVATFVQKLSLNLLLIIIIFAITKLKNYYFAIACIYMICIVKEELRNERFNELIKYLQID